MSLSRSVAISQCRYLAVSLSRSVVISQCRYLAVSLYRYIDISIYRKFIKNLSKIYQKFIENTSKNTYPLFHIPLPNLLFDLKKFVKIY